MLRNLVSVFNGVRDRTGIVVPTEAVVHRIRTGEKGLAEKTRNCNVLSQTDAEAYATLKVGLPAVTFSGVFQNRRTLVLHSGMVVLDFDDVDVGSLKADVVHNRHVLLAFISPSGAGLKVVVPVSPVPKDAGEHKMAFSQVCENFSEYETLDTCGNDVTRLCFLSHDSQLIFNPDASAVLWEQPTRGSEESHKPATRRRAFGKHDVRLLDFIDADDYTTWLSVGMAIADARLPFSLWDEWSQKSGKYDAASMEAKWSSFRGQGISWGTVVHLASLNGWQPEKPFNRQVNRRINRRL